MRFIHLACALAALFLLLGCAMPWDAPIEKPYAPPAPQPGPQEPVLPEDNITVSIVNETVNETNESVNATELPPVEPELPLRVPRNMSDNIGDGEFDLVDLPLEPMKVYFINDGFADAILVRKGAFAMLVDAGNAAPVKSLLSKLGISRLNVVVATRDYSGAVGGLSEIIEEYEVDEFWHNGLPGSSADYRALLQSVRQRGIIEKKPFVGDYMEVGGLRVDVLNPQKQLLKGSPESDAIVMKLSSKGLCVLLLNPTVHERENAIMGTGQKLDCQVATYFMHGEGRPAPSLLVDNNAALSHVVISVGPNSQGLPSPTTLTRLQRLDVWRTDEDGTVGLFMDLTGSFAIGAFNETYGNLTTR